MSYFSTLYYLTKHDIIYKCTSFRILIIKKKESYTRRHAYFSKQSGANSKLRARKFTFALRLLSPNSLANTCRRLARPNNLASSCKPATKLTRSQHQQKIGL